MRCRWSHHACCLSLLCSAPVRLMTSALASRTPRGTACRWALRKERPRQGRHGDTIRRSIFSWPLRPSRGGRTRCIERSVRGSERRSCRARRHARVSSPRGRSGAGCHSVSGERGHLMSIAGKPRGRALVILGASEGRGRTSCGRTRGFMVTRWQFVAARALRTTLVRELVRVSRSTGSTVANVLGRLQSGRLSKDRSSGRHRALRGRVLRFRLVRPLNGSRITCLPSRLLVRIVARLVSFPACVVMDWPM